jgi:hypothetical protein
VKGGGTASDGPPERKCRAALSLVKRKAGCQVPRPRRYIRGRERADITGFNIALSSAGAFSLAGTIKSAAVPIDLPRKRIERPDALPFTIDIDPGKLTIQITADINLPQAAATDITASLDLPRVLIRAKSDPTLLLALGATYEQSYNSATGASSGKLTRLEIVEPYPFALVALAARPRRGPTPARFRHRPRPPPGGHRACRARSKFCQGRRCVFRGRAALG